MKSIIIPPSIIVLLTPRIVYEGKILCRRKMEASPKALAIKALRRKAFLTSFLRV